MSLKNSTATLKLNTGAEIPVVGLGTWRSAANDGYDSVLAALRLGYRHIDAAAIYGNEDQVGRAIKDSGVPRQEIFITTKLWGTEHRNPAKALDSSLKRLGLDYVDLYLMHWPVALKAHGSEEKDLLNIPKKPDGKTDIDIEDWDFIKTWELMQELPKTGKTKAIGVSNFSINNLKALKNSPKFNTVPAANQVEIHPLFPQTELIEYCKSENILIEAYSPFGSADAPVLKEPELHKLAEKYNISTAQLIISWSVQRGYVVLPKSVHAERIEANLKVLTLKDEDMETITNLSKVKGEKRLVQLDWSPFPTFE